MTTQVRSNVIKDHFDLSQYFQYDGEKSFHGRSSWELAPYDCSSQLKTLKILPRGVNLCQGNATSMIMLESVEWFDLQHNFLFWTRPKHSLLQYGLKMSFTSKWEKHNKGWESAEKGTKKYGQWENRVHEVEDCDPPSPPSPLHLLKTNIKIYDSAFNVRMHSSYYGLYNCIYDSLTKHNK